LDGVAHAAPDPCLPRDTLQSPIARGFKRSRGHPFETWVQAGAFPEPSRAGGWPQLGLSRRGPNFGYVVTEVAVAYDEELGARVAGDELSDWLAMPEGTRSPFPRSAERVCGGS